MVKLAQHIWPSIEIADNGTNEHIHGQVRKQIRRRDGTELRRSPRRPESYTVEIVRSKSERSRNSVSNASEDEIGDDDQATRRQRQTLADLFQVPVAGPEEKLFVKQKSSSRKTSETRKSEVLVDLQREETITRSSQRTSSDPPLRDKVFPKRLFGSSDNHLASKTVSIEIPEKMIGLAWLNSEPLLLPHGCYSYPSHSFSLEHLLPDKNTFIKHGSLHRLRILEDHLGVAWVDGRAVFLEPGVSIHSCSNFSYITTDDKKLANKEFVLGPFRVVTVHDCEVGIKFCNRKPQVLYSGRHCLSISKVEVFAGFESLLKRHSSVSEVSAISRDNMTIEGDLSFEWHIEPEDAAAARLANITDVEEAVCAKMRRAFALVMWAHNGEDLKLELGVQNEGLHCNGESIQLLPTVSSEICSECADLFEEGWTVKLWAVQLQRLHVLSVKT